MTFPSGAVMTCPVVVGRATVVAALEQALDDAEGRRRRVVLFSGEAGIGKSRLIEEAKRRAAERRYLVIEGACFPQDRDCPYAPSRPRCGSWSSPETRTSTRRAASCSRVAREVTRSPLRIRCTSRW